jgi:hypothetical protein
MYTINIRVLKISELDIRNPVKTVFELSPKRKSTKTKFYTSCFKLK